MANKDSSPNTKEEKALGEQTTQTTSIAHTQPVGIPDESIRRFIRAMAEGERIDTEKWLSTLDKLYDGWKYSSAQRIAYTVPILNEEQKTWYEHNKSEIKDDWTFFCERFKQNTFNLKPIQTTPPPADISTLTDTEAVVLEDIIDAKFDKYSGVGDAKNWLLHTMNQFKACGLRRDSQFEAIPLLLEGDACLWYVENVETILNFEVFSKLFLQQFKPVTSIRTSSTVGTGASATTVPDNSPTSHLQRTVADDIIKRPTYFRGSQDDVHNWLDKLEQRFTMAQWSDENKLHYISIHLQDNAYRWWMQTSSTIKTWSSFRDAVIRAFGSTRIQELAFEQLKWYKQTVNQSITQYYDKIIELCQKVDPAMPDSLKLKYLMAGIKESLKTHVALQDPKTTETFLSSARKIEDVFALTNTDNEVIPNDATLNATTYQSRPNQPSFTRTSNNNFGRSNSRYTNPTRTRSTHYQKTSSGNNAHQQHKPSKFTRSNRRSNDCFKCGTPGHYARDCTRSHFQ
jgi:hypothetical protein